MASTFHGLELGKRGLMVGQASIATTGHNIANANTKGYSRQQVNTTTSPSLDVWTSGVVKPGQLGSGVTLDSITRVRDRFLDQQFRDQSGTLGEFSVKQEALSRLETIINEPSETGLRSSMDQLWGAWQDLANAPDSLSARSVLKERAQEFVSTAQSMDRSMTNMQTDLNQQLTSKTNEVNGYLNQIAELNTSILRTGKQANDLLDQRDVLVENLSKLVPIKVDEQKNGVYNITLRSDGTSLVEGIDVKSQVGAQSVVDGGELSGLVQSIDMVSNYQSKLTDIVKGLVYGEMTVQVPGGSNMANGETAPSGQPYEVTVKGMNGLHQLGWSMSEDANGNVRPGAELFIGDEANFSIASLQFNPEMKDNVKLIAASLRSETVNGQRKVISGNSDLAQLLGNLRSTDITINGNSQRLNESLQSMVSGLGAESQSVNRSMANYEAALQATEGRRQSVTGVSLDEEMANLIKYQHSYSAAARMISTTDQMLDTIINRMAAR